MPKRRFIRSPRPRGTGSRRSRSGRSCRTSPAPQARSSRTPLDGSGTQSHHHPNRLIPLTSQPLKQREQITVVVAQSVLELGHALLSQQGRKEIQAPLVEVAVAAAAQADNAQRIITAP